MKTFTKLALAAASGYAFRAYLKRDTLKNNDALRHSVDRRLSVEGDATYSPTFLERQAAHLGRKIGTKFTQWVFGAAPIPSRSDELDRRYYNRNNGGTRYARFGRRGNK